MNLPQLFLQNYKNKSSTDFTHPYFFLCSLNHLARAAVTGHCFYVFCEICLEYFSGLPSRFSGTAQERGRVREKERQQKEERWEKLERTEKFTKMRKIQLRTACAVELHTLLWVLHERPGLNIQVWEKEQGEKEQVIYTVPQVEFHTLLHCHIRSACWSCTVDHDVSSYCHSIENWHKSFIWKGKSLLNYKFDISDFIISEVKIF